MFTVETSITINRPVEHVFAFLSNFENQPKWDVSMIEVKKTSPEAIGVGTTWRVVPKALGRRIEGQAEVIEYELNRKITEKSKSPFPVTVPMTFERVDGGTRVNVRFDAEPGGFFKLAEPLIMDKAKRVLAHDLAKLKGLMEAQA
jgi:uncharacterized membrane protein